MRRSMLAFAAVLVVGSVDVVACNSLSGVGDFTFTTASSTSGSGGSAGSNQTSGASAGSTPGSGGSGGAALEVVCLEKKCPVVPGERACCFDNPTLHTEAGRCVSGPPAHDGCSAADKDAGHETRIECSGPGDCDKGELCCATYGGMDADAGTGWYTFVACAKTCDPPDQRVVCDGVDGGGCPQTGDASTLSCGPSQLLPPGYFTCR